MRATALLALALAAVAGPSGAALDERCGPAPFGDTPLYLRGTWNQWTADEDHAFTWVCDAYLVNVEAAGRQDFKIGDAAWRDRSTFGGPGEPDPARPLALSVGPRASNLSADFAGGRTLRLSFDGGTPVLRVGPRTFDDPRRAPVTDALALSLRHDSRSADHKRPFGAVTEGRSVDFAIDAQPGVQAVTLVIERRRLEGNQDVLEYTEVARLPMQRTRHGARERWTARHRFDTKAVYGYHFVADIGGRRFVYQNNRDAIHWTREKGSNGLGAVAALPERAASVRRFRLTVYDPGFTVPAYARDLVYYYVFPERFRNGDPANDPRPGRDTYQDHAVEVHPRWMDTPWRPGSGDGSDAVHNNDFFGGDLAGLIDRLDHIRSVGANAIYLTPIFAAASNHKYDTGDYRQVDPRFGRNEDFRRLCEEAARRGIRVIVDTSFNHTGSDSVYFDRFARHGADGRRGAFFGGRPNPSSPWASWYRLDPSQPDADRQYTGWAGVADLPELDKADLGFRRFAYGPDGVTQQWLALGAAGWRMDVAPWVPDDFWREWRQAVKAAKPDALTIAETWFEASKFLLGDTFDSTMNYLLRNALLAWAAGGSARDLVTHVELMRELYPPPAFQALMNVLSTHDAERSLHALGYTAGTTDPARIAEAKQRFRLALFFQMTFPGAPAIFYGDEVGMTGANDPYNRGPFPWADQGGRPDIALLAHVQRLTALRHALPVLRHGSIDAPLFADDHVVVHARRLGGTWALTASNNATEPRTVTLVLPAEARAPRWSDPLSGERIAPVGRRLTLVLPALDGRVLVNR